MEAFQKATKDRVYSYSRKAYPWDNACIESFHALLKREWINRSKILNYAHAHKLIFEYIETFYNTIRIHCIVDICLQIIGPSNYKPSTGTSQTSPQKKPTTSPQNVVTQNTGKSDKNQTQKKPTQNRITSVIQTVKTGDEAKTMIYVFVGLGVLIIAGIAVFLEKRKNRRL